MKLPSFRVNINLPQSLPAILLGIAVISGTKSSEAASIVSVASGSWNVGTSWTGGVVPGTTTADAVFIRGNRTITLDSVAPAGSGSITTVYVGEDPGGFGSGMLIVTAGGSVTNSGNFQVMRVGNSLVGASGTMTMTGGSVSVGGILAIGAGSASQTGSGSGILGMSGTSSISVTGATNIGSATAAQGTGFLNISGNAASFTGSTLLVSDFGNINFTFNSLGVSTMSFSGIATFNANADIVVNGSAFAGTGTFTLIDAASFTGTPTIALTGFGAGSSYNWDTATGLFTVTVVPEPAAAGLVLGAGGLLALGRGRRRYARPPAGFSAA